jgi:hypothetical protein
MLPACRPNFTEVSLSKKKKGLSRHALASGVDLNVDYLTLTGCKIFVLLSAIWMIMEAL